MRVIGGRYEVSIPENVSAVSFMLFGGTIYKEQNGATVCSDEREMGSR